ADEHARPHGADHPQCRPRARNHRRYALRHHGPDGHRDYGRSGTDFRTRLSAPARCPPKSNPSCRRRVSNRHFSLYRPSPANRAADLPSGPVSPTIKHMRSQPCSYWSLAVFTVAAVCTLSACHRGAPADILTNGKKLYSQHAEELIIRHFFDDQRGGVFLDVGCWDWKEGSTTLYLEEKLGWSGIGVDAQPKVRQGYEQHRPHTKFQNYIVTDRSGGTGKLFVGGQVSSINERHVEQFGAAWDQTDPIEVPTITLNDLLAQNGLQHLDFLSMDIEGAEPKALAG